MKHLAVAALLCLAVGCGGGSYSSEAEPEGAAPANPAEARRAALRSEIQTKKGELAQANTELQSITRERESLAGQGASETKNNRLIELARLEMDTKQKKESLAGDIESLEQQLQAGSGGAPVAKPKSADAGLDEILAVDDKKIKDEADRKRRAQDDEKAAERSRLAEAERAKLAEEQARAAQKVEGGRLAAANVEGGPVFEERWADVIQKVRAELQKFKRW